MIYLIILCILAGSYLAICFYFYIFQRKLIFIPSTTIKEEPPQLGLEYQEDIINTVDNNFIVVWRMWFKKHQNSLKGSIVYFHGNRNNVSHYLKFCSYLASMGYEVFSVEYRGYGKSSGLPSQRAILDDFPYLNQYFTDKLGKKNDRLILYGCSLGGAVAIKYARSYIPQALIIESSFSSLYDLGIHRYFFLPIRWLLHQRFNSVKSINHIACKKLIMHSPHDNVIPYKLGRKLYNKASDPKVFFEMKGNHRNGWDQTGIESMKKRIFDFIEN